MSKRDGGPAFPWTFYDRTSTGEIAPREWWPGMTLRDYFAAAALQASIEPGYLTPNLRPEMAAQAYAIADAMLAERDKQ